MLLWDFRVQAEKLEDGRYRVHDGFPVAALEARPGHRLFKSDGVFVEMGRAAAPETPGRLPA